MAVDPRLGGKRPIYMNVPAGYDHTLPEQSFEELRVADYIKAYLATGNPPAPCPAQPIDPSARINLGLPPLFQPHTEIDKQSSPNSPNRSQAWEPAPVARHIGELFTSITCSEEYAGYSFEELRCMTYSQNNFHVPQANLYSFATDGFDTFQNICCAPEHAGFSPEELRVAFLDSRSPLRK